MFSIVDDLREVRWALLLLLHLLLDCLDLLEKDAFELGKSLSELWFLRIIHVHHFILMELMELLLVILTT